MNKDINIERILETNLKDYMSEEIDKQIEEKVKEFETILKSNKDHYIEHIMKNIRILHEYNIAENRFDYHIIFRNIYEIKKDGE
jgi:hypothetical protein